MPKLNLSIAVGDYDRTRPLFDGSVQIEGVDAIMLALSPEEMFFRAMRHADFDICELSLSSYTLRTAKDDCPYIAVPVFLSRAFRHTAIYVRKDRIQSPADLKGKRVGLPEYQLTANVWARALLADDFGVAPEDMRWMQGGIETPGRPEKLKFTLPANVDLESAPEGATISDLLDRGEIDAFIGPRPPAGKARTNPNIGWLFDDPTAAAKDYFKRTQVFPIMHLLGIRKSLVERHPWLPMSVQKAFTQAKALAMEKLADTSATKVMLPFVEEQLKAARETLGPDYWSYGLNANRPTLETFLRHHHAQGLSARRLNPEALFHPASLESYAI